MNGKREAEKTGKASWTPKEKKLKTKGRAMSKKELSAYIFSGAVFALLGYIFAGKQMVFSTYPLGFALLSASARHLPFTLFGYLLFELSSGAPSAPRICACALIIGARIICRLVLDIPEKEKLSGLGMSIPDRIGLVFSESRYLRMMSSGVGVFFVGVYNIVAGSFRFYDLFGTFFYLVITPLATLFFTEFFDVCEDKAKFGDAFSFDTIRKKVYELACLSLIFCSVYSLSGHTVLGISLSLFLASFATLYYARKGFLWGIISGLFFGLACAPIYAPLFAFCAIVCASLSSVSLLAGCIGSVIVGIIWGIYVGGFPSLTTLFPALFASSMLYCSAEKLKFFGDISRFFTKETRADDAENMASVAEEKANGSIERIKGISDSFSALSEIFYNLSSKLKRPAMLDLRHICDKTFDEYCPDCDDCDTCWGIEYSKMLSELGKISASIQSTGKADVSKISTELRDRCLYLPKIIDGINSRCAKATKNALFNEKTEIFALDFDSVSKILGDAIKENELDYKVDKQLSQKLSSVIEQEGYGKRSVMVYGTRKKTIIAKGLDLAENASGAESLKNALERACSFPLDEPIFELSGSSVNMRCESKRRFLIESCFEVSGATEEKSVCGDSVSVFENKNNYFYSLISDGMGTGQNAAFTSEVCNVFLRNMLLAGNKMEVSLKMLNSIIRAKRTGSEMECSATVDLLEIDTYSGQATLIKSGAAPTYLIRGGNVFKLAAKSIPVGIIKSLDAKQINFKCLENDIIVMVSDGVFQTDEENNLLPDLLLKERAQNIKAIAEKVITNARINEKSIDDISVTVLKVS